MGERGAARNRRREIEASRGSATQARSFCLGQSYNLLAKKVFIYIDCCKIALESPENINLGSCTPTERLTHGYRTPSRSERAISGVPMNLRHLRVAALASVSLAVFSTSAFAQIETIVVTAEKRSENIQTVPIAITALSGEQLKRAQIHDFNDLQQL